MGLQETTSITLANESQLITLQETGPSEAAYLKLSPSEAEFGSKSSELSRVEFAFRVGQKLPPPLFLIFEANTS